MNSWLFRKTGHLFLSAFAALQVTAQTDTLFQPAHVITLDSAFVLLGTQLSFPRHDVYTDTLEEPFGNHSYVQKITQYNKYKLPSSRQVFVIYSYWDLPADDAFSLGGPSVGREYSKTWYYSEFYEYSADTVLIKTHQTTSTLYDQKNPGKAAAKKRGSVTSEKPIYSFVGRIGEVQPSYLHLKNSDTTTYRLSPETNSQRLTALADFVIVEPLAPAFYSVSLPYDEAEHYDTLFLVNDSIKISFIIYSFGYHVCSSDIRAGNKVRVTDNFIYYRTGSEALMHIYPETGDTAIATFSLAQTKTEINLETLRSGKYTIETVDFHTGIASRALLIVN